jgi:CRP/FNR family transcriptional regulator
MAKTVSWDPEAAFPGLADLEPTTSGILKGLGGPVSLAPGAVVFEAGLECTRCLLLLEGCVRVYLLDAHGHEIVLYRVRRGETCILSTAALLAAKPYAAHAVVETAAVATAVPIGVFELLMGQSAAFRKIIFASHADRIVDLLQVVGDVAFTPTVVRLARHLAERADRLGVVSMTHDEIAVEVGTAREVVSRNLKTLERDGCLRLAKRSITIIDRNRLATGLR